MRLLIVGGYGTFGGRIVELLEGDERLTLIVAGRSRDRAERYCASRRGARARLEAAEFDRNGDVAAQLARLRPDVVVDASGPFQAYGAGAYRLLEACIAARIHYLDLADGSDFVAGVAAFDASAKAAGVYALSGVSSFPVLTAAVVRRLTRGWLRVGRIEGCIAPSPFAAVGANVIRAIASYAGQRIVIGQNASHPFTEHRRCTIAPPGGLPLRSTLFSLVDVPDLRVLTTLWPQAKVWMGAGPVPEILHRALIACAWLVRLRLAPSLSPLAPLMHWATNRLRWGEHRGGMYVSAAGLDGDGCAVTRSWHLIAEGADGPLIPSMAVQAIVLKDLEGAPPASGARACVEDVELDDYERLFTTRRIYTGVRDEPAPQAPLYQRLLGDAWRRLPPPVRAMHEGVASVAGVAHVERGRGALARIAAWMMSFPAAQSEAAVRVTFASDGRGETWRRSFGAQSFRSRQYAGAGRSEHLLCERFGALEFAMGLAIEEERLHLVLRRWKAFGVPLPL